MFGCPGWMEENSEEAECIADGAGKKAGIWDVVMSVSPSETGRAWAESG